MEFETLIVTESEHALTLTINRPAQNNSINTILLNDINQALDVAAEDHSKTLIILEGQQDFFCSGMDFHEILSWQSQSHEAQKIRDWTSLYMQTLRRFSLSQKIFVAKLNGKVIAGGTGLVAASDYAISTDKTQFKLTEVLWGLLPAMVTPYLIKRIGYQKTYDMTLTARSVPATEASQWGLIDEINPNLNDALSEFSRRIMRLKQETIFEMKSYFRKFSRIDELTETRAIEETTRLLQNPTVRKNIRNFVEQGTLPY
jgi:polyketide biosynthesis enoyl-CoA hydratase PksH